MLDFDLGSPLRLSSIGDSFVNLAYSLALSKAHKKPVGLKVSNTILSRSVEAAGLRGSLGTRVDKHKLADYAEGLIFKAWAEGRLGLQEAVELMAGCFSGSEDKRSLREESVEAFTRLIRLIESGEGLVKALAVTSATQPAVVRDLMLCGRGEKKPLLTVDCVVEHDEKVLLIKRKNPPFAECWALPGGFVEYLEKAEDAVIREVREEANVDITLEGLLGVYSEPGRDPRGHVVSICYVARSTGAAKGGSDAEEAKFFDLPEINYPELAFDHDKIIKDYVRLKSG